MANGLDPRVLQQQGRAFQIAASTILQKRQNEAQAEDAATRTMLSAGIKLFDDPNIPPDAAGRLLTQLMTLMGVGGEQVTGEDLSARSRDLAAEEFGMSAALQSLGDNPENVQAGLGVLSDPQAGLGGFTSTVDPEIQQRIATGKATELATGELGALREAQRGTEVGLNREEIQARINKLNRETKNVGRAGGPKVTDVLAGLDDLERSLRTAFGDFSKNIDPGTEEEQEFARKGIQRIDRARVLVTDQVLKQKGLKGLGELGDIMALSQGRARSAAISQRTPEEISSQQPGLVTAGTQDVATVSPQSAGGAQQQGAPARPITALRSAVDAKKIKPDVFLRRLASIQGLTVEQFKAEAFRLATTGQMGGEDVIRQVLRFEKRDLTRRGAAGASR